MNKDSLSIRGALEILQAVGFAIVIASLSFSAMAQAADDAQAQMQKDLNAQVANQPFQVEDIAKIDAYVADAMKKNLQPRKAPPAYWHPGYTCDYIYNYHYIYSDYRDCIYYHRYYGRYW